MGDAERNSESMKGEGQPKAKGDAPCPLLPAKDIAAGIETASSVAEQCDASPVVPLTIWEQFLLTVAEALEGPYTLEDDGVIYLWTKSGRTPICDAVWVKRMEIGDGDAEARMIVEAMAKGEPAELAISAEVLGSSSREAGKAFLRAGVRIYAKDGKLGDFIRSFKCPVVFAARVTPGWSADEPRTFGLSGNQFAVSERHAGDVTITADRHVPDDRTVKKWHDQVGSKLVGNPYALFMVCTALSGPILDLLNWKGGIFNFAFETSSAKTTGLIIANHVWRTEGPLSWKNTRASLDDACFAANGTFIALDEVPEDHLPKVEEVVFDVCNGTRRGARPTPGQKTERGGWNTVGASTSEYPLIELAQADGAKGRSTGVVRGKRMRIKEGTFVRLVDVGGR